MSALPPLRSDVAVVHAGGSRPTARQLAREGGDVLLALPLFATAPLLRHWHRRWGATDGELASGMPGDELVPGCQFVCTRAITIDAPPTAVWPWLAQVGLGKAGFYSNDLLDNAAHPSANQIIGEFQHPQIGEWVPMFSKVNEMTAFRVADVGPPASLLWAKADSTWAWKLIDMNGRTRLITRVRARYDWSRPAAALVSVVLMEFGDFPMIRAMLRGIKRRAERAADG